MHLPVQVAKTQKTMHSAICLCATVYINLSKICKKHANTGCTGFKIHAPGSQNVHTGCRVHLDSEHCKKYVCSARVRARIMFLNIS